MTILRRIFPLKSTCPHCSGTDWLKSSHSRSGAIQYRRCKKCRTIYRVHPLAVEHDNGGMTSDLRTW